MAKLLVWFRFVPFRSIPGRRCGAGDRGCEVLPSQERRWVFAVTTPADMVLDEGGYGAMGNCRDSDISAARGR